MELLRMKSEGIIRKQTEPTDWVNSMVVIPKPNGKVRICIEPRDLNKAVLREHYPMNRDGTIGKLSNQSVNRWT